jgi:L-amino acid N-acyltransferase YncA
MPLLELTSEDADAVLEFFFDLTAEDRTFFWDDLTQPSVVERWVGDPRRNATAVVEDDRVVAFAALVPQTEWSSHVAELVLVVAGNARRRGHGRTLAQAMLLGALRRNFTKVTVQVAADRPGAIAMFQGIGFQAEALLRDHLREPDTGQLRDLVILSHLVEETYAHLLAAGLEEAAQ